MQEYLKAKLTGAEMWRIFYINPAVWLGFLFLGLMICYRPVLAVQVFDLSNFEQSENHDYAGWLISEKLDGVRAIWDGKQLLSKRGNPIAAPEWFTEKLPPFAVDGELWTKRQDFENIASIVLRDKPDKRWRTISYQIFEVPNQKGALFKRLNVLRRWLEKSPVEFVRLIEQIPIQSNEHLQTYFQEITAKGGEGVVVRKGNSEYLTGRLHTALKLKPVNDAECKVIGYTEGKGKFSGMVGSLHCELLPDQMQRLFPKLAQHDRPVEIKLGSGLSHAQRLTPPKIGQIVTFEYNGLTAKGLPRFARFKRVRKEF